MTTVNYQVEANADDGGNYSGSSGFIIDGPDVLVGYRDLSSHYNCDGFARWTGVSIEGTIDGAVIQFFSKYQLGSAILRVYGIDEDNPPAPTTAEEFEADPLTSASIDWDGNWNDEAWNTSPELKTIFQELVDTYTISNEAVMAQIKNDGGTGDNFNCYQAHEDNSAEAAKLDIDYTAGGVTTRRYGLTVLGVG